MPEAACTCVHEAVALPDEPEARLQALPAALLSPDVPGTDPRGDEVLGPEDAPGRAVGLPVPFAVLNGCGGGGFPKLGIAGAAFLQSACLHEFPAGTQV